MFKMISVLCVLFSSLVFAQTGASTGILTFQQWRGQQVAEAENRVARLSNRIVHLNNSEGNTNAETMRLGGELRVAQKNIDVVRNVTFETYFNVYLSQYAEDDTKLKEIVGMLANSKEELTELIRMIMKTKGTTAFNDSTPATVYSTVYPNVVEKRRQSAL